MGLESVNGHQLSVGGRIRDALAATLALEPGDIEHADIYDLEVLGRQIKYLDTLIYKRLNDAWRANR